MASYRTFTTILIIVSLCAALSGAAMSIAAGESTTASWQVIASLWMVAAWSHARRASRAEGRSGR